MRRLALLLFSICVWVNGPTAVLAGAVPSPDAASLRDLGSAKPEVSNAAMARLTEQGEPAIAAIAKVMPKESVRFRTQAVAVFAAVKGDTADKALATTATCDPSANVRTAAATAIRDTHREAAARFLVPLCLDGAIPAGQRHYAVDLIRSLGDKDCIDALIVAMEKEAGHGGKATAGLTINASNRTFAGYDNTYDVPYKVKTKDGEQTLIQHMGMPVINAVSVESKILVAAGGVLNSLTGQPYGSQAQKWREWWSRNRESFAFPAGR